MVTVGKRTNANPLVPAAVPDSVRSSPPGCRAVPYARRSLHAGKLPSPRTAEPVMKRVIALAVCVAIGLGATLSARPARAEGAAAKGPATIEQFLKIRTPGAPVIMPDGSLLLRDWPDGVYQLYRVTPNTPGASASY